MFEEVFDKAKEYLTRQRAAAETLVRRTGVLQLRGEDFALEQDVQPHPPDENIADNFIERAISFLYVKDPASNRWKPMPSNITGGFLASPPTTPTIVNFTTGGAGAWELALTLPANVKQWNIQVRTAALVGVAHTAAPATYMTLKAGQRIFYDTAPTDIYVQDSGAALVVEIEYWV